MDISQELKDTENALREFISAILQGDLGDKWLEQLGVSADRVSRWRERKETEGKRQEAGVVEERLLHYADFYDLKTILQKHWARFAPALGDWKTMEVYLSALERFRDQDAHRRELLPHQKHLILGIGGEIRTRLVRYRSKQETTEDYFPRIECVRDSLGNIWSSGANKDVRGLVTKSVLRPGDRIDFVVTAADPMGESLEYCLDDNDPGAKRVWQESNTFTRLITPADIGRTFVLTTKIKSRREFHAKYNYDDSIDFYYVVLPPRE